MRDYTFIEPRHSVSTVASDDFEDSTHPEPRLLQTGITGTVVDSVSGTPIPGATVVIIGAQLGSITDRQGRYAIDGVSPGAVDVGASFVGYRTRFHRDVRVDPASMRRLDFTLTVEFVVH